MRLYDDLNSFLALSYTKYYFHSSISNVFAHLIALMYTYIVLFLFNLHNVSEAISTINYRARNLSWGTFSPRQKCPPLGGTFLPRGTFSPRQKCPPGHSFLGTVVRGDNGT